MRIILPDGFPMPENARPGEAFEVVATIQPSDDGSFTLTAVDGMEMPAEVVEEAPVDERMSDEGIVLPFE